MNAMERTAGVRYPALYEAVRYLAGRCDYATTEDGMGFNKLDATLGHSLAEQETWTPRQAKAAYEMVQKYVDTQLVSVGITHEMLDEDHLAVQNELENTRKRDEERGRRNARVVTTATLHEKTHFALRSPYDEGLLKAIKSEFPFHYWERGAKLWLVGSTLEDAERLVPFAHEWGFGYDAKAEALLASFRHRKVAERKRASERKELSKAVEDEFEVDGLAGPGLRTFQRAGVRYAVENRRVMIADEMGTGKTVQALATVEHEDAYPVIVAMPASVKTNWAREAQKWVPHRSVATLSGYAKDGEDVPKADIILVNYAILTSWLPALQRVRAKAIIYDESHKLKEKDSQRSKSALALSRGKEIRILLTGTPMPNRPIELVHQLNILDRLRDVAPDKSDPFWSFARTYANAHQISIGYGRTAWDMTGSSNEKALNDALRATCYVRREKSDVLTELPPRVWTTVPMDLANRGAYEAAENAFRDWLFAKAKEKAQNEGLEGEALLKAAYEYVEKSLNAEALTRITKLKQEAAKQKMASVVSWLQNFLEGSDQKIVVFAHHKEVVAELMERLDAFNPVQLIGGMSASEKQSSVDAFQNDENARVFVGSLMAAGEGITLTAASNVAFVELGWNPSVHRQAEDRVHRFGQEAESVNVWYLTADATIEEDIAALIEEKRESVTAATTGEDADGSASIEVGRSAARRFLDQDKVRRDLL